MHFYFHQSRDVGAFLQKCFISETSGSRDCFSVETSDTTLWAGALLHP